MLRIAYLVLPTLLSTIAALSACLPWGAPLPIALALPLIAMSVIFFWAVHRPGQFPSVLVFLIGLVIDLATDGPLGFWALNFLIGYAIGNYGPGWLGDRRDGMPVTLLFGFAVFVVSTLSWLLTSLFFLQTMPVRPLFAGGLLALACYPLVSYLLAPLDRAVGAALRVSGLREDEWR